MDEELNGMTASSFSNHQVTNQSFRGINCQSNPQNNHKCALKTSNKSKPQPWKPRGDMIQNKRD